MNEFRTQVLLLTFHSLISYVLLDSFQKYRKHPSTKGELWEKRIQRAPMGGIFIGRVTKVRRLVVCLSVEFEVSLVCRLAPELVVFPEFANAMYVWSRLEWMEGWMDARLPHPSLCTHVQCTCTQYIAFASLSLRPFARHHERNLLSNE